MAGIHYGVVKMGVSARKDQTGLVFITGRGGAGFALGGPAVTRAWGAYFVLSLLTGPVRGPPTLIP